MAEKQPSAYVVLRYTTPDNGDPPGDNWPVKVFDTRREARAYVDRMDKRTKKYGYMYVRVKQG